jgi:hypothetical protein
LTDMLSLSISIFTKWLACEMASWISITR